MPDEPPRGSKLITNLTEMDAWSVLLEHGLRVQRPRFTNNPDVWGIEVGIREEAGDIVQSREPCLKVYVYRKGEATTDHEVDRWTSAQTERFGRVAFRTDVEPLGIYRPQQGPVFETAAELVAGTEKGSGFCVVEAKGVRYLLSAGHVFDNLRRNGDPVSWQKTGNVGRGYLSRSSHDLKSDRRLWPLWRDRETGDAAFADLGMALIGDLGPYQDSGSVPKGRGVVDWNDAVRLDHVVICGKSRRTNARFVGRIGPRLFGEAGRDTVPLWRLLKFKFIGSRTTSDGDSGAPILSENGRWVGMHIGTIKAAAPKRRYGVALCAGDIIERLRLVLGDSLRVYT